MRGTEVTDKQMRAAEQFILLLRKEGNALSPDPQQMISVKWEDYVRVVAYYGAVRADSIGKGGSVDEPGETYKTAKSEADDDRRE